MIGLGWAMLACLPHCPAADSTDLNIVLIFTDNEGAWTLGCYGNPDIQTPNIDRLAAEGVRFTRAYANNPVCSPNRATLLTGLMPSQHGVHCFLTAGPPQVGDGAYCTIREFPSLPKMLKARGYACGMIGKWHLGANMTPQEGFDDAWVTMPHGATSTFFDADVIENGSIRKEPEHLTQFWTKRALQFLDANAGRRFFLYLPYNGPYGLGNAQLKDNDRIPHMKDYAGNPMKSFPRSSPHPWLFNNRDYINNEVCMQRYAAEMTTLDDGVGAILRKLDALGIAEKTLVVFAGDNGWSGGQQHLWGMGDHTRPLSAFDSTMQVPLIYRHKGHIPAGITCEQMVSHLDFLPTFLDYAGIPQPPRASQPQLPGRSYAAALRGKRLPDWSNTIYYEFETLRCIRTSTAKWIERRGEEIDELYDLIADPDEEHNLAADPAHAGLRAALKRQLDGFFDRYATPEFDLWKGGRSKAKLISGSKEPAPKEGSGRR